MLGRRWVFSLFSVWALVAPTMMSASELILATGQRFEMSEIEAALDTWTAASPANSRFVVFVHGRGNHPRKAINEMLPYLESEYDTRVLMFHWEGSRCWRVNPICFPQRKARASARNFLALVKWVDAYRQIHSARLPGATFSLLTHSMGSIVVEEAISREPTAGAGLFDNVILSASASKSSGHTTWMEDAKLARSSQNFVTLNASDGILAPGGVVRGRRLGKELVGSTARNAHYVDVQPTGVNHRYFLSHDRNGGKNGQQGNPCMRDFYRTLLRGEALDLDTFPGTKRARDRVYTMKKTTGGTCQ